MSSTLTKEAPVGAEAVPVTGRRMTPLRTLRHSLTLFWRSTMKLKHSPEQLLDITLQPVMFVVIFVFLFGGAISGNWHNYLPFVLPGIMVQTVVMASMGTGVGLNTDITKGIFDRFRSLPIARSAPLVGTVMFDVARYLISGLIVLAFGLVLGFDVKTNAFAVVGAFGLMIAFAFALCWVWVLLGLSLPSPTTVQGVGFGVMFPLTFGSNLLVQTNTLPGWLQAWVKVNPVTSLSDAVRGLLVGGPVLHGAVITLAWSVGLLVVFAPLAVRAYRRKA
jgi:oleandomycin transport system permease protein